MKSAANFARIFEHFTMPAIEKIEKKFAKKNDKKSKILRSLLFWKVSNVFSNPAFLISHCNNTRKVQRILHGFLNISRCRLLKKLRKNLRKKTIKSRRFYDRYCSGRSAICSATMHSDPASSITDEKCSKFCTYF